MTNDIVVSEQVRLGSLEIETSDVIRRATGVAKELATIINDRKLHSVISGRKYVQVTGWSTLGAMLGVLPRELDCLEHENGDFEATVELIRSSDGAVVGRGSAIVGVDEPTWNKRPRYARRSMAITRATGKAYRLGFAWIMTLAGYEATPAEEMDGIIDAEIRDVSHSTTPVKQTVKPATVKHNSSSMTIEEAEALWSETSGCTIGCLTNEELVYRLNSLLPVKKPTASQAEKIAAIRLILEAREKGRPVQVAPEPETVGTPDQGKLV